MQTNGRIPIGYLHGRLSRDRHRSKQELLHTRSLGCRYSVDYGASFSSITEVKE